MMSILNDNKLQRKLIEDKLLNKFKKPAYKRVQVTPSQVTLICKSTVSSRKVVKVKSSKQPSQVKIKVT